MPVSYTHLAVYTRQAYTQGTWTNHAARRKRKLLLHREELDEIEGKIREKGRTIVPVAVYF